MLSKLFGAVLIAATVVVGAHSVNNEPIYTKTNTTQLLDMQLPDLKPCSIDFAKKKSSVHFAKKKKHHKFLVSHHRKFHLHKHRAPHRKTHHHRHHHRVHHHPHMTHHKISSHGPQTHLTGPPAGCR